MSGLSSCNSWKELKKPQNPFFGAMFSRSHRKRKRKRVLQPINNPAERGRSLEPSKNSLESTTIRSISLENQKILPKALNELDEKFVFSTESSIEVKRPPKPQKSLEKNKPIVSTIASILPKFPKKERSAESSLEKHSFIDEAVLNNTISMRKKYVKANVEESKVLQSRPSRKIVKSPVKLDFLPYAPDLKPVSINSFQLGITRMEFQLSNFFENTEKNSGGMDELIKKVNCKLMIKGS